MEDGFLYKGIYNYTNWSILSGYPVRMEYYL